MWYTWSQASRFEVEPHPTNLSSFQLGNDRNPVSILRSSFKMMMQDVQTDPVIRPKASGNEQFYCTVRVLLKHM
jgi:hypothetical protein